MSYICLNCGKELRCFQCDCGINPKIWNSGDRKNRKKTKLSQEEYE